MKYISAYKDLTDRALAEKIEEAAAKLESKILKLDIEKSGISDYNKRYFKDYLRKLRYSLQAAGYIIANGCRDCGLNLNEIVFLDYGGGIGIVALLAKELGIGTVLYNDIYELSCQDARILAKTLDLEADHYIPGGIDEVIVYLSKQNISLHVFSSRNVIEHIYNLEDFFHKSSRLSQSRLAIIHATTANIHNPLVRWYTQRIHKRAEYKINNVKWSKDRDALKPYLTIREELIKSQFPLLSDEQIKELAIRTRGKIKEDIFKITEVYLSTGQYPIFNSADTNTCDPLTGNWAEHLLPVQTYQKLITDSGFQFSFSKGFYNENYKPAWLNIISRIVNKIIAAGFFSITLSPFILIKASRKN